MNSNVGLMAVLFIILSSTRSHGRDSPNITSNAMNLNTKNDDIAHFTCTAHGRPPVSIKWEKAGKSLSEKTTGVAMLAWTNETITESHLFIAVSGKDRRGQYTCVVSNTNGETRQTFVVAVQNSTKLKKIDLVAIGIGIGITLSLVAALLFFLIRGSRRLKERKKTRTSPRSVQAHENTAVEEDIQAPRPLTDGS